MKLLTTAEVGTDVASYVEVVRRSDFLAGVALFPGNFVSLALRDLDGGEGATSNWALQPHEARRMAHALLLAADQADRG